MFALKFNPFVHFTKISLWGILVFNGFIAKGQGWDWENNYSWQIEFLEFDQSGMGVDRLGNFYTSGGVLEKQAILKNSFGFQDTFYQSQKGKHGHILTKFNRRGKKIWQVDFPFALQDEKIICKDNLIYIFGLFRQPFNIQFGSSNISLAIEKANIDNYFVFIFDTDGNEIKASHLFKRVRGSVYGIRVVMKDEANIFISHFTRGEDSILFNNSKIKSGINGNHFIFSITLAGNLNWFIDNGYSLIGGNNLVLEKNTLVYQDHISYYKYATPVITKCDLNGNIINKKVFNTKPLAKNYFTSTISDNQGGYIVSGELMDTLFHNLGFIPVTKGKKQIFIAKLDSNFNILWYWKPYISDSAYCYNPIVDSKENIYSIITSHNNLLIGGRYQKAHSNGDFVILKLDTKGSIDTVFEFEVGNQALPRKIWLDKNDDLFVAGGIFNSQSGMASLKSENFEISGKVGNSQLSFTAKYGAQPLEIVNKSLYCKTDSLTAKADTTYKWLKWMVDNKDIYYGKTIRPNGLTKGWHKVRLYGYEQDSMESYKSDSFYYSPPPKADISLNLNEVCRYTPIIFSDNSTLNTFFGKSVNTTLNFGDGQDTSISFVINMGLKLPFIYTQTGVFDIKYIVNHGNCSDTMHLIKAIKVIDAPKPGFSVQQTIGCSPFTANFMDTVTLNVKQKDYFFSDNNLWINIPINQFKFKHVFLNQGAHKAIQRLIGSSGCVIQTDSVMFNISKGLTVYDSVHVSNASIENGLAKIKWDGVNGAVVYNIFKDNRLLITTKNHFYTDQSIYDKDAVYYVKGLDSCGSLSSFGRVGKPIFLKGKMSENNSDARLQFSQYWQWKKNKIEYKIEKQILNDWVEVNSQTSNNDFADAQTLINGSLNICYRIKAFELSNPNTVTFSNVICLDYFPAIYIPNAFSPNNDGVNDIFEIKNLGITYYKIKIYNRWGQLIFEGMNNSWNGEEAADGIYMAIVEYGTSFGIRRFTKSTITLIR